MRRLIAAAAALLALAAPPAHASTSVLQTGAGTAKAGNDSTAFQAAIDRAATGDGIVTVPAGYYRVTGLVWRSGVSMLVDPAATLMQPYGTTSDRMVTWDGVPGAALSKATIRSSTAGQPFLVNIDAAATGGNADAKFLVARNVQDALIQDVRFRMNASRTDGRPPSSTSAAITYVSRPEGITYRPTRVVMRRVSAYNAPAGYGPTQITSGLDDLFDQVATEGGTAVRLETDNGVGELRGITVTGASCRYGNRALTLTPHLQANYDVHATNVTAYGCAGAVFVGSEQAGGYFAGSSVDGVDSTAAAGAQIPSNGGWAVGTTRWCVQDYSSAHPVAISSVTCR